MMKKLKNYAMSYPNKTAFEQVLDSIGYIRESEEKLVQDNIDYYLQLEKEQIEQAFRKGQYFSTDYFREVEGMDEEEAYYYKEYVEPKLKEQSLSKYNKRQREIWLKSKSNEQ